LGRSLETLSEAFTSSAKRWETIVYPSLFAFILLAAYGFYLIYNLTSDVSKVADYMETIATNMSDVSVNMNAVSHNMVVMTQTVDAQSSSMHEMTVHMRHMSMSMGQMRYDLSIMNNSVSRPMSFMNTFMPW
jgi:methyl-accepting chemotaxis protein